VWGVGADIYRIVNCIRLVFVFYVVGMVLVIVYLYVFYTGGFTQKQQAVL
jgi:hypothetical protein